MLMYLGIIDNRALDNGPKVRWEDAPKTPNVLGRPQRTSSVAVASAAIGKVPVPGVEFLLGSGRPAYAAESPR